MLFQTQSMPNLPASIRRIVLPTLTFDQLFLHPKRQLFVTKFQPLSLLEAEDFKEVYLATIRNYADFVQLIPSNPRGVWASLLDQALLRADFALHHIDQMHEKYDDVLFRFALFTAALYIDLGKTITQHDIYFCNEVGELKEKWQPLEGDFIYKEQFYRVFPKNESYAKLKELVTPLLARQIMPEGLFLWLAEDLLLLTQWLSLLQGDFAGSGTLGKILSFVMREELDTGFQGENILPKVEFEPKVAVTRTEDDFIEWLIEKIEKNELSPNQEDSILHFTKENIFLQIPNVFQLFVQERPQYKDWQQVSQKIMTMPMFSVQTNQLTREKVLEVKEKENVDKQKMTHTQLFETKPADIKKTPEKTKEKTNSKFSKLASSLKKMRLPGKGLVVPINLIFYGTTPPSITEKVYLKEAADKKLKKWLEKIAKKVALKELIRSYRNRHI